MRFLVITIAAGLLAMNASAMAASHSSQDTMKTCSASWKTKSAADKKATTYKDFMSSCMKGGAPAPVTTAKSGGTMATCAANWKSMPATAKKGTAYKSYMSTCMKGSASAAPANAMMAAPKTTAMKPANTMKSASMKGPAKSAIPTEGHTGTSARCKDGTVVQIKTHMGACSRHGGVAAWL